MKFSSTQFDGLHRKERVRVANNITITKLPCKEKTTIEADKLRMKTRGIAQRFVEAKKQLSAVITEEAASPCQTWIANTTTVDIQLHLILPRSAPIDLFFSRKPAR